MSRSVFLGRQITERTAYVRNRNGRLVETVTVRDPDFTDDDRAWAIALHLEEKERCTGCGQPLSDCMDPKTARTWSVYRATCQSCLVLEAEQDNDVEKERNSGRRDRGQKYMVKREI